MNDVTHDGAGSSIEKKMKKDHHHTTSNLLSILYIVYKRVNYFHTSYANRSAIIRHINIYYNNIHVIMGRRKNHVIIMLLGACEPG